MEALFNEWETHFQKYITRTFVGAHVKKIDCESERVFIECSPHGEAPERSGPYEAVILALGFGEERQVDGLPFISYWNRDALADTEGKADTKSVSGVGDGGLIDALRIVHKDFRHGRLSLDLVEALRETGIPELIKAAEKRVRDAASGSAENAACLYDDLYKGIYEDLPPVALGPLDRSLRTDLSDPVAMFGRTTKPYSLTAAPIHKLMLAHAIVKGAVVYRQAELRDGPSLLIAGEAQDLPQPCIVRHGPNPDFGGLLSQEQIDSLQPRQMVLDDVLAGGHYDGSYWAAWSEYPQQVFDDPAFVAFRFPAAQDYVLKEFKIPLEQADLNGKAGYQVRHDPRRPDLPRRVPAHLFGITTRMGSQRIFQHG